jgi:hypothetical protein
VSRPRKEPLSAADISHRQAVAAVNELDAFCGELLVLAADLEALGDPVSREAAIRIKGCLQRSVERYAKAEP